jgi:uncharacterized membrane protein
LTPYLRLFGETFYEQIIRLVENAIKEDYLYNKLNYEEVVFQSHHEIESEKLKRIGSIAKSKQEIQKKVDKRDSKFKEISVKLRSLIHGMLIIIINIILIIE